MSSHRNETDAQPFVATRATLQTQEKQLKVPVESEITRRKSEPVKQTKVSDRRFTEREHFHRDEIFEYERNGTDPGTILIFNQEVFDSKDIPIRRGSRRDVNEIILCLQRLGFNIYEKNIHTDLTVEEIKSQLDLVANDKEALQNTNCLIVFFLSHGHSNDRLHAKDTMLQTSQIWAKFAHCEELQHKPKMFIFQACKGEFYTTTTGESNYHKINDNPAQLVDFDTFSTNPLGPDILLVFATLEGNLSFRNPLTGTWFIQELCKNFSAYGRRDDVLSMITRTIKCVCGNYYNKNEEISPDNHKQMPVFVSTLSKKFYLNRSKDRNVLLNINKETQEIHQLVSEIAKYIKIDLSIKSKKQ